MTAILQLLVQLGVPVCACGEAVGVHPRMALHAALMATVHHIAQRVEAWVFATGAGQITRPWLVT